MCHGQYEYSYRKLGPNMNIHKTWLTYVRTGPKKKKSQPGSAVNYAVNSSIDQGEFRAMKTLSGYIAPRCDKDQLCDKITVST